MCLWVPRYPMRKHLTPRCSYFLVSLRVRVTVPFMSSFLWKTGSFIFYFCERILWYFWLGSRSNFMSTYTEPVRPPKNELSLS
jgi:hypothetical protein